MLHTMKRNVLSYVDKHFTILIAFLFIGNFITYIFTKDSYKLSIMIFIDILFFVVAYVSIDKINHPKRYMVCLFLLTVFSLQVNWPIFMPMLSFDSTLPYGGYFIDSIGEKNLYQEAKIAISPPLIPIFFNVFEYRVANDNFRIIERLDENPNVQIQEKDGTSIKVTLKDVNGFTWREIVERIKFTSKKDYGKDLVIPQRNITDMYPVQSTEKPYFTVYGTEVYIRNDNTFPVTTKNVSSYLTDSALNNIIKWINRRTCVKISYTDNENRKSYVEIINNKKKEMIDSEEVNESISFFVDVYLDSKEEKSIKIFFERFVCDKEEEPPPPPYPIDGYVTLKGKPAANNFVKVKNIFTDVQFFCGSIGNDGMFMCNLADMPAKYKNGENIQIKVCKSNIDILDESACYDDVKNIKIEMSKGYDEVNIDIK